MPKDWYVFSSQEIRFRLLHGRISVETPITTEKNSAIFTFRVGANPMMILGRISSRFHDLGFDKFGESIDTGMVKDISGIWLRDSRHGSLEGRFCREIQHRMSWLVQSSNK
jgi:hypothetical protein